MTPEQKQELVEKVARAIFDEYYPNGCGASLHRYENTEESHRQNLRRNAQAAIDTITPIIRAQVLEALVSDEVVMAGCEVIEDIDLSHSWVLFILKAAAQKIREGV